MKTKNPIFDKLDDLTNNFEYEKVSKKMILAAKIIEAMEANGINKNIDFAKLMNQKPSVITKWLSGTHNFTIDTLWDIAEKLKTDVAKLVSTRKEKPQEITFKLTIKNTPKEPESLRKNFFNERHQKPSKTEWIHNSLQHTYLFKNEQARA